MFAGEFQIARIIYLIQCIEEPSIALTNELMQAVDVLVATGGPGMVTAAYSSGKPSFGVGPGNVQVIIDDDIDFNDAADKVIRGRKFDNGIICSGEQSVIAKNTCYDDVIAAFKANGAYYVEDQQEADVPLGTELARFCDHCVRLLHRAPPRARRRTPGLR